MDLAGLTAIDVHTHAEVSSRGGTRPALKHDAARLLGLRSDADRPAS
jgi:hypothetical protein